MAERKTLEKVAREDWGSSADSVTRISKIRETSVKNYRNEEKHYIYIFTFKHLFFSSTYIQ
jgi:hypothetical protein